MEDEPLAVPRETSPATIGLPVVLAHREDRLGYGVRLGLHRQVGLEEPEQGGRHEDDAAGITGSNDDSSPVSVEV